MNTQENASNNEFENLRIQCIFGPQRNHTFQIIICDGSEVQDRMGPGGGGGGLRPVLHLRGGGR